MIKELAQAQRRIEEAVKDLPLYWEVSLSRKFLNLIDELIHRMGWIQRSKDGNREKIENRIRTHTMDRRVL